MQRNRVLLFASALLLITAHRSPAPIRETPETPTPTVAPTPEAQPPPPAPRAESKKAAARAKEKKSTGAAESSVPAPKATSEISSKDSTAIPKGAVHLVINTESDARKIFAYFRFPQIVAKAGTTGLYRVEVNPDGTVAAVTILKSMGSEQDVLFMKAFVTWRAVPGPLRLVDVPRHIFEYSHVKHIF